MNSPYEKVRSEFRTAGTEELENFKPKKPTLEIIKIRWLNWFLRAAFGRKVPFERCALFQQTERSS